MQWTPRSYKLASGFVLAAAILAWPGGAVAQAAPKVAIIDTQKIMVTSKLGKAALADFKKIQEQKEKELGSRQQEIKDLQEKINQGRLSLAEDKIGEMEKQLEEKVVAARRMQEDATTELNKRRDEMLASIDQKVMPVINQLGKEQGFSLIFRKFESGLIYADEAIDITDSVVQKLDGSAPKGN
jgi:outer membrane protein